MVGGDGGYKVATQLLGPYLRLVAGAALINDCYFYRCWELMLFLTYHHSNFSLTTSLQGKSFYYCS